VDELLLVLRPEDVGQSEHNISSGERAFVGILEVTIRPLDRLFAYTMSGLYADLMGWYRRGVRISHHRLPKIEEWPSGITCQSFLDPANLNNTFALSSRRWLDFDDLQAIDSLYQILPHLCGSLQATMMHEHRQVE
jgi:hypothetical protein